MSAPRFRVDPISDYFIRLIDIMFGLTITQGFVIYKDIIVMPKASLNNLSLLLVYVTIILSWVGYHKSIQHYPYNKSYWSRIRLFFDITILFLYAYLVFVGQDLSKVLLGLAIIFVIYAIDGISRMLEWHDKKVSQPWLSALLAFFFGIEWYASSLNVELLSWFLFFLALIFLFGYRLVRSKLGYPRLSTLGVDVDGVLGDQVPPVLQRIQKKGKGIGLTKESITDWNFKIEDTDISREIEEALLDPSFVKEMPVVQGSTSAMEQLYKKYHIVIATSRPLDTEKETKSWLKKNYKFHEFVNTREIGKNKLGLDVLIDDNLDNAEAFASLGGYVLLISQPWNRYIQSEKINEFVRAKKIVICEDWSEVPKSLEKISHVLERSL
jgi:5'(3')-deoxyribonucleotidase